MQIHARIESLYLCLAFFRLLEIVLLKAQKHPWARERISAEDIPIAVHALRTSYFPRANRCIVKRRRKELLVDCRRAGRGDVCTFTAKPTRKFSFDGLTALLDGLLLNDREVGEFSTPVVPPKGGRR